METPLRTFVRFSIFCSSLYAVVLLGLAFPAHCAAQASSTASRGIGISAFGGYIYSNPEYGPAKNSGGAVGFNITKFIKFPVQPALEFRGNLTNGTYVKEKTYLVGVRGQADVLRVLHPYVDFLIGTGTIHFNLSNGDGYTGDNSTIYDFGGGVDIDLVRHFQLRADLQEQHWSLGSSPSFTPVLFLIGVNYNFHFKDYNSYGYTNNH
jgi:hypothetical protein